MFMNALGLLVFWILIMLLHGDCELIIDKNSSYICLDCTETQQASTCNIPFCTTYAECKNKISINNFTLTENNDVNLLCREDSSLTFGWKPNTKTYYFIEYSKEGSNESWLANITSCNFQTIYKLTPNQKYLIQLYSFSMESKILFKSRTIPGYTTKVFPTKTPVKSLNYSLQLENDSYSATVTWKPGADLSCRYEIDWYQKKGQPGSSITHRWVDLKKQLNPEFNMTNLDFGKKYVFSIMSIDKKGEKASTLRILQIAVPSCLESYKNIYLCPPETPKNVTIIEGSKNGTENNKRNFPNIQLKWNRPKFQPKYYIAKLISKMNVSDENFTITTLNISGINVNTVFENITLGIYNQIMLTAYSDGGNSKPVYVQVPHQINSIASVQIHQESFARKSLWIWISLSGILIAIMLFIFRVKIRCILLKYLNPKQRIDDTVVKYVVNDIEDLKWELNEAKLTLNKVIGVGAFGEVQKGWFCLEANQKIEIAVKMLKARPSEEQITQFYNEIDIMKAVPRHSHIVYLIGVITKDRPDNPLMLVEYCAKGDLQTFLRDVWLVLGDSCRNDKELPTAVCSDNCTKFSNKFYDMEDSALLKKEYVLQSKDLLSFARQIVLGMEFLSSLKMVHRDLAARNILLTENCTIKISDFGLCRDIYTNNVYQKVTAGKLPFRWMALESLTHQVYTTESDVWSFGIVLWEIVTLGGNPFPTIRTENLIPLLKEDYRMENPVNCSEELYHIMLRCWEARPSQRPTFTELRETFNKLLESEIQYINLEDAKKLDPNYYENVKNTSIGLALSDRYIVHSNKVV